MSHRTLQFNVFASLTLVALSLELASGGQKGQVCAGSSHCEPTEPCTTYGKDEGGNTVSCTKATRILHETCTDSSNPEDECTTVDVACAKVVVYVGGPCENGYCSGSLRGYSYELKEPGC